MRLNLKKQKGSFLIEALISVAIFLVGVLGIMELNGVVIKQTAESKFRADASFYAQEVAGRLWADKANIGSYTTLTYAPRLALATKVANALPGGTLGITLTANGTGRTDASIAVGWRQAGEPTRSVITLTTVAN
jgi:type IV pilus assembly protein PilV